MRPARDCSFSFNQLIKRLGFSQQGVRIDDNFRGFYSPRSIRRCYYFSCRFGTKAEKAKKKRKKKIKKKKKGASPLEGKRCRCKRGRPCWRYCCLVVVRLMYGLTERLEFRRHKTAHLHSPLNENARWQFVCHHANKSLASNAGFCKQI